MIYSGNAKNQEFFGMTTDVSHALKREPFGKGNLGLKPDNSNFKLQLNFFCLMAKHYIWICRLQECYPTQNKFLPFLKHMHQLENNTLRNSKKWKPFLLRWNESPTALIQNPPPPPKKEIFRCRWPLPHSIQRATIVHTTNVQRF